MRIGRSQDQPFHVVEAHSSRDARVTRLGSGDGLSVVRIELGPGGVLGMHPAVGGQLFVLVAGEGTVAADRGEPARVAAGTTVFWSAGERHETRTETGLTAIVVEAEGLAPAQK